MKWVTRLFIGGAILFGVGTAGYLAWSYQRDFNWLPDWRSVLPSADSSRGGFTFLVMGDNEGDTPIFQEIIRRASAQPAQFLVNVADLTPNAQPADFELVKSRLESLPFPYYTAVGNNDIVGDRSRSRYLARFNQSQLGVGQGQTTYYSFDEGPAHFVVLDNADRRVGFDDDQLAWLDRDLAQTDQRWIFLFMHRPVDVPLTDVYGDDETPASRRSNEAFKAVLRRYPVTRIYTGHLHVYFSYELEGVPVTITGGGGAAPQAALADLIGEQFHYLEVEVTDSDVSQTVHRLDSNP